MSVENLFHRDKKIAVVQSIIVIFLDYCISKIKILN